MDVVAVLDYLGIDGADDYGTSMGGRLAQQLAARHPHRVRALGIGCTSPGGPHGIGRDSVVSSRWYSTRAGRRGRTRFELMYTPAWLTEASRRHPDSAPGQQESPGRLAWGSFVERVTRIELAL
ncbi:alpha/beta fold hydrolase [Streptomyces sp. NPDC090231]|uniref:alpha/beta fold hydrolase n=1 Tax=Streptomyces sp. NPDC090231 TaxID=3365958 RepID=UPI003805A3F4